MKLQKWALFIEAYCIIFNFLIIIKPIFQIITEHLLWKTMKAEHQELKRTWKKFIERTWNHQLKSFY